MEDLIGSFGDYDFPTSSERVINKIDLNSDGVDFDESDNQLNNTSMYFPDGTIYDFPAYQTLLSNLQELQRQITEIPNPVNDPQFANLFQFTKDGRSGQDFKNISEFYGLSEREFNSIYDSYIRKLDRYENTISTINSEIGNLTYQMNIEKKKVADISKLRGKEPNYNNKIINKYLNLISIQQAKLNQYTETHHKPIPPLYNRYYTYCDDFQNFRRAYKKYDAKVSIIQNEKDKIKKLIVMEKWRASYVKYARINKIEVDLDSDDIFTECNEHYLSELSTSQDWRFNCPCDRYRDSDEEDDYWNRLNIKSYGHTVELDGYRCTYGTKIVCCTDSNKAIDLIGFIAVDETHFANFVEISVD
jgi:hypothetical protein